MKCIQSDYQKWGLYLEELSHWTITKKDHKLKIMSMPGIEAS